MHAFGWWENPKITYAWRWEKMQTPTQRTPARIQTKNPFVLYRFSVTNNPRLPFQSRCMYQEPQFVSANEFYPHPLPKVCTNPKSFLPCWVAYFWLDLAELLRLTCKSTALSAVCVVSPSLRGPHNDRGSWIERKKSFILLKLIFNN